MIKRYEYIGDDVVADIRDRYGFDGDLAYYFALNKTHLVHKWHHYIPLYDRYFGRFRRKPVRMLEIGVKDGGSLQMWRRYLGPEAIIFGVDIDKKCAALNGLFAQVRIGSQNDAAFMASVIDEMGGVDIVLDDGSHQMDHIKASLEVLFPLMSEGGVYMIEDLHAAYWSGHGGGLDAPANFFNTVRRVIDDMHSPYHNSDTLEPALAGAVTGLHIHDSIVVIDKGRVSLPVHSKIV